MVAHLSDSAVQREAEKEILSSLSDRVGMPLTKRRIDLPGGTWTEVDGASPDLSVLAEASARQGKMKGGQKRKVALDVLKLITIRRHIPEARLVLRVLRLRRGGEPHRMGCGGGSDVGGRGCSRTDLGRDARAASRCSSRSISLAAARRSARARLRSLARRT